MNTNKDTNNDRVTFSGDWTAQSKELQAKYPQLTDEDLNRKRVFAFIEPHLPLRLRIVSRQSLDRDKLRHHQSHTAATLYQAAKRVVGHPRHRRKN